MTAKDWADLDLMREVAQFREVLGIESERASNAEVAHAVYVAGIRAIKEQAEHEIYVQMASDIEFQRAQAVNRQRLARRGRSIVVD